MLDFGAGFTLTPAEPDAVAELLDIETPCAEPDAVAELLDIDTPIAEPEAVGELLDVVPPFAEPDLVAEHLDAVPPWAGPDMVAEQFEELTPSKDLRWSSSTTSPDIRRVKGEDESPRCCKPDCSLILTDVELLFDIGPPEH